MKYLNFILIIIGAFIAMYRKAVADNNQYVLIVGIVMLMIVIYRLSKTIPSKDNNENEDEND